MNIIDPTGLARVKMMENAKTGKNVEPLELSEPAGSMVKLLGPFGKLFTY